MTDPRIHERAEHRLAILARQLERVGISGLLVVTEADPTGRAGLRRSTESAVGRAGLGPVLVDARARFRDWLQGAYNRTRSDLKFFHPILGATMGPVEDRLDVFMAVDDAVLGTVARELITDDERAELLEPFDRMFGLGPPPSPRRDDA
jgi:hypothetical protein